MGQAWDSHHHTSYDKVHRRSQTGLQSHESETGGTPPNRVVLRLEVAKRKNNTFLGLPLTPKKQNKSEPLENFLFSHMVQVLGRMEKMLKRNDNDFLSSRGFCHGVDPLSSCRPGFLGPCFYFSCRATIASPYLVSCVEPKLLRPPFLFASSLICSDRFSFLCRA